MSDSNSSEQPQKPNGDPETSAATLSTSQFDKLIAVVEKLNVTMEGQKSTMEKVESTLVDHGKKFDILTRDALKNDQPYDQKDLDDESTCMALYDMVMAKTKEKADEWKETMEVTLIFIIIAVLCALGRRWVRKLTIKPNVKTWREKMLWHIDRMRRAEHWLQNLMEVLYSMLLSSIGLFMAGLLYQLWNLSGSFEERPPILLAAWGLGVVLASGVAFTMVATTYHAVRYEASIFEGLISKVVVGQARRESSGSIRRWLRSRAAKGRLWFAKLKFKESLRDGWAREKLIRPGDVLKRGSGWIREIKLRRLRTSFAGWLKSVNGKKVVANMSLLKKVRRWIQRNRVLVGWASRENMIATYLDLIAEASDPSLLDRAVASLSYQDWVQYGDGSMHQLVQVYTRLTATDTSFRVKETVNAQISRFSAWIAERRKQIEKNRKWRAEEDRLARGGDERFIARSKERADEAKKEDEEERRAIQLTEFLVGQRKDYISRFLDPTWENCSDICHLLSLPFDGFIAKCLCINDHNINLGNHHNIFYYSVEHCCYLYSQEFDDVMRIVSHVDLFSAVRSFVLSFALTDSYSYSYEDVLEVIIGDRTTEVLHFLCEFLSTPRDWSCIDPSGASAVIVIAAGSPPQFPPDLDLSPIIAHIARRRSGWNWGEVNDTLIAYLVRCEISALSERVGVHEFLQNCVDRDSRDKYGFPYDASEETRHAARTLLDQHRALFNPPCPPSRHSASINDAEDIHVPWLFDQSPDVPDSNSDQSHSSHDVPSTSEPGDPPETHTPPVDMPLPLAANIRLPSEDHELIDMSAPSEPGT